MPSHQSCPRFLLTTLLSLSLVSCFGGHGGGGGGGNGGNGNGGNGNGGAGANNNPIFAVDVADSGNFQQGQKNATYTIDVTNIGKLASTGAVQVTITIPAGETFVSISGTGWTFPGGPTATRTDSLAPGASWGILTITVNVGLTATSPQVLMASISGGGAATASNQDSTAILTHVSILFGHYAFLFGGFDANGAVAIAGSINVDVNGNVTGEEDFKDPSVVHAAQTVAGFCQNVQAPAGFCKLTAGGRTSQYDFVLRDNNTVARMAEDPVDGANTGSGVLIAQQVPASNALVTAGGFNGFFAIQFVGTDDPGARLAVEGNIFTNLGANIVPQGGIQSQADVNENGTLISPANATTTNVTGSMAGPVDTNGRATAVMHIGTQNLTLAFYILAPQVPASSQSGRAFAVDITPIATSKQVLTGQFYWLGNSSVPVPPFDSTMISGVNVFAFSGVIPAIAVPPMPAKSNISVGTFTTSAVSVDVNAGGQVNNGGTSPPPALAGTVNGPIAVASNGRAVLSTTVNGVTNTYILYLDDLNDGDMMGTDNIVNVGFFTGRGPTSKFDNAHIAGTYVIGTDPPVLATVPNGVSPLMLTPNGACTATCSGTFSAGSSTGNYSFVPGTGRGTALATSGKINQNNTNAVFYIITPGLMVIMGDDQGVTSDALAFIQF